MAAPSADRKRALLQGVPLFGALPSGDLAALAAAARTVSLRPRQQLFHKGDGGSELYVVMAGRLKALTTSAEGDDVVFGVMKPGDVIGEVALLAGTKRTATLVALDACQLLAIDRRDLLAFLKSHADASIQLLQVLATRLKDVSELVEDTLFLNLPLRLAKKLARFAETYGERGSDGIRIDLKLSQEEWGDLVGATRESINKQLRGWSSEGLISLEGGYVVIHRMEVLEKLARQLVS